MKGKMPVADASAPTREALLEAMAFGKPPAPDAPAPQPATAAASD